jgi:hypothetical protein
MHTGDENVILLGKVVADTRGGLSGVSDADSGMMMHAGLADDD